MCWEEGEPQLSQAFLWTERVFQKGWSKFEQFLSDYITFAEE